MKTMKANSLLLSISLLASIALVGCGESAKTQIGILQFGTFDALTKNKDGFISGLAGKSFADGESIDITIKNPETDSSTNTTMAASLAASSDLVFGIATPSATALKTAVEGTGRGVPVLFSAVTDPVGANLVASTSAPGGSVTGTSDMEPVAKAIDLLKDFAQAGTTIDKVACLYTATESNSIVQVQLADAEITANGWATEDTSITKPSEISTALAGISEACDAVFLPTDNTIAEAMTQVRSANEGRNKPLIVICGDVGMIPDGGIIGLGVDYFEIGKLAGEMAARILNGADPKDIPVQYCDTTVLTINQTEATKLGISIPNALLATGGAEIV